MALILQILPCGDGGPDGSSDFSEPPVLNPNNRTGGRLARRQNATTRGPGVGASVENSYGTDY